MRIVNLIDNISNRADLKSEHGLSYYIETSKHKILFDCGQGDAFIENAKTLGIDLRKVDLVVISHGHYDHGGGIDAFLKLNHHAKVYLNKDAFHDFYSKKSDTELKYIGINKDLIHHAQIKLVNFDTFVIDETLTLYSSIKQLNLSPLGNKVLLEKKGDHTHPDTFKHEQSLVIHEDNNVVLMAGCAHNGIVNILEQIVERSQLNIKHVFGGFHLYNLTMDTYEDDARINQIANELLKTDAIFYTGHCTGIKAYELLKSSMNNMIEYNSVGTIRDI